MPMGPESKKTEMGSKQKIDRMRYLYSKCHDVPCIWENVYYWPPGGRAQVIGRVSICPVMVGSDTRCDNPASRLHMFPGFPNDFNQDLWNDMKKARGYYSKFFCTRDPSGKLVPYGTNPLGDAVLKRLGIGKGNLEFT